MKIGQNKVVEFVYELEVDGQVVDKTVKERPLDYIHGTGSLLPKLEEHIEGMEAGDKFDVTLSPAEAYGEITDDMIQEMPAAELEAKVGQSVSEGDSFRVTVNTGAGYQLAYIKILSVEGDTVFYALTGSDLAGEYLTFTITLDSIA